MLPWKLWPLFSGVVIVQEVFKGEYDFKNMEVKKSAVSKI